MDEDVRSGDQRAQSGFTVVGGEIQHDGALSTIHVDEHAAHPRGGADRDVARIVTLGRFDFDDVGTHVGHDLRAVGPHHHRSEVDDANARERSAAHGAAAVAAAKL